MQHSKRYESAKSIVDHIKTYHQEEKIILLGDFNALEDSAPIQYLLDNEELKLMDSYRKIHQEIRDSDVTFYGWKEHIPGTGKRIDYIFYHGNLTPFEAYVSDYHKNMQYPSDHMPVIGIFK